MVSILTNEVTDVLIDTFTKQGIIVPELPTGSTTQTKQSQLIASIHKRRVLRIMATDYLQTSITQLLSIFPMGAVRQRIAHHRKVLVAVCTNQLILVRLSI